MLVIYSNTNSVPIVLQLLLNSVRPELLNILRRASTRALAESVRHFNTIKIVFKFALGSGTHEITFLNIECPKKALVPMLILGFKKAGAHWLSSCATFVKVRTQNSLW